MISLTVEKRPATDSIVSLRRAGKLPAVFYGPKEKATSVTLSHVDFVKAWKKAGESSVIILKDGNDEHEALIHDIDVHPVTGTPRHVDFYVIEKGKKVKVKVALTFQGVSPAVKDLGAILIKVLREIEIEAGAKDLPHELVVDISSLATLTSVIHASDIKLPAGVDLKTAPDEVVASIAEAIEEVEEVKPVDMSTIEVAKKGKEAKEGEEGAEAGDAAAAAPAPEKKK